MPRPAAPRARPTARDASAAPTRREPPPRSDWYAEPAKVFDNLYFLGTRSLNSWAITTSGGIVIIDPLYDYIVEAEIIEGLRKVGLDPADITHVLVSHGHGDHYGGARRLQREFGASVVLSAPDWDLMRASSGIQPKPARDIEGTDGQQFSVGDTQLTLTLTPGHTPGTISTLIPVRDGGRSYVAALWGGTAMRYNADFYNQYIASAQVCSGRRRGGCRRRDLEPLDLRPRRRKDRGAGEPRCGRPAPVRHRRRGDPGHVRDDPALRAGRVGPTCAVTRLVRLLPMDDMRGARETMCSRIESDSFLSPWRTLRA